VPIGADVIFHRGAPHGCVVGSTPEHAGKILMDEPIRIWQLHISNLGAIPLEFGKYHSTGTLINQ
jgi:hypothetical protein